MRSNYTIPNKSKSTLLQSIDALTVAGLAIFMPEAPELALIAPLTYGLIHETYSVYQLARASGETKLSSSVAACAAGMVRTYRNAAIGVVAAGITDLDTLFTLTVSEPTRLTTRYVLNEQYKSKNIDSVLPKD